MEEDSPLVPRVVEGQPQFLDILDDAEAPLRVRVGEGIESRFYGDRRAKDAGSRIIEQRF